MTGKSKATDGADEMNAAGLKVALETAERIFGNDISQYNSWEEHLADITETAIRAYLAALPPPTGEPVAWRIYGAEGELRIDCKTVHISISDDGCGYAILRDNEWFSGKFDLLSEPVASAHEINAFAAPPQVEPAEGERRSVTSDGVDIKALQAAYEAYDDEIELRPREGTAAIYEAILAYLTTAPAAVELLSLTEALKSIAEFSSGDETTLGALRRLVEVRAIAIRALEKSGR